MVPSSMIRAHDAAGERLCCSQGSVRAAFDSLNLGFRFEDLISYIDDTQAQKVAMKVYNPREFRSRLIGLIAAAIITAIESDRLPPIVDG